jgi:hypothetical protein
MYVMECWLAEYFLRVFPPMRFVWVDCSQGMMERFKGLYVTAALR